MKRCLTLVLVLFTFLSSLSGFDINKCTPEKDNLKLLLGKWETVIDGEALIYMFTDRRVSSDKPYTFGFYILKEGEWLNSRMDPFYYSLVRAEGNENFIIFDSKNQKREIVKSIVLSVDKIQMTDLKTLEVLILEKQRISKGGENEKAEF